MWAILVLLGVSLVPAGAGAATQPAVPALGSGPSVRLSGNAAAVPPGAVVVGPTDPSSRIAVDVALRPRDPVALAAFARDVSTPGNPNYHRYLPADHLAAAFGPTPATVRATRSWLVSTGLSVGATSSDGLLIPVKGTALQVASAFAVPLVQAKLSDGRAVRLSPANPAVPSTLVPAVQGVIGLSTPSMQHPQIAVPTGGPAAPAPAASPSAPRLSPAGPQACQAAATLSPSARTATQVASTYGLTSLYAGGREGAGQTVGIFELEPHSTSDVAAYQTCFGTNVPVSDTQVDGGPITSPVGEAVLDIEVVAGLAPGASIQVYTGPNDGGSGPIDTYARMVDDDTAKVLTTSWGGCEADMSPTDRQMESYYFAMAASQGQTVLAASGDAGSTDCYSPRSGVLDKSLQVDDPASQPNVTSVGGTSLTVPTPGSPTERVWNSSSGAGGGGNSTAFVAPTWQQVPGAQSGSTSYACGPLPSTQQCRQVPDVSATADPTHGDVVFVGGRWNVLGGTSISSPTWAAVVADVGQGCAATPGLLGPALYAPGSVSAFNDVTVGSNDLFNSVNPKFPATTGYDLATGWGTPRAAALLGPLTGASAGCPAVTGLSPSSGPAAGGSQVVISGSGFGSATPVVRFGGVAATVLASDPGGISVTVRTPSGTPGPTAVTVTSAGPNGAGTSPAVASSTFTYLAPQIASVVPNKGPVGGGAAVTISGAGFGGASIVSFGGVPAVFALTAPGTIVATVPQGPASGGTVDIIITATLGTSKPVSTDRYTYALPGYWLVGSDGGIFSFGHAEFFGSTGSMTLNRPIVSMAATPDDRGYWLVASDGGIFAFGDAGFFGSTGSMTLNRPIVSMAATPDGGGYWLVASDGGIFAFGDAVFQGSTGNLTLNQPIVGMAATPDNGGYWLVASDGGIFAFGDAVFHGSTGNLTLNRPIVGMTTDLTGGGYWLVASDGGIFAIGDAGFFGSTGSLHLNRPIVGMTTDLTGDGYWLVASDGGIFAFGDAPFLGSTGSFPLNRPVVGMAGT